MTRLVRCSFLIALSVAALSACPAVAAGTWTSHAWTGDADSGITQGGHYTVAVHLLTAMNRTNRFFTQRAE